MKKQWSEARLNDLVYLTLKQFFFEQLQMNPRGCDIRVCMNLAADGQMPMTMASAILLPTEIAPGSHDKLYDIETDRAFEVCIDYLEDHWMKRTFEDAYENQEIKTEMLKYFNDIIIPAVERVPEDQCCISIEKS